jgi:hypothetical protein
MQAYKMRYSEQKSFCTEGAQERHPLQLYMEYVSHLYRKMPAISEQERFEVDMQLKYHERVESFSKSFRISYNLVVGNP